MGLRSPAGEDTGFDDETVKSALQKIVESRVFAESPRLRALLEFLVTRSLDSASCDLKETVIGVEVFGKACDFDPRLDATVRVAAKRLRAKLRTYYDAEGAGDLIRIALPEGHYVPRFSELFPGAGASDRFPSAGVAEPHPPAPRPGAAPRSFVGRQAELSALRGYLDQALAGNGRMVCLVAEPGAGKTALIESFLETAVAPRGVSAVGRCRRELERTEPYLAWLELLEELAHRDRGIESILQTAAPTWWGHLRMESTGAPIHQGSPVKREMRRFLRAAAEHRPLVLVLEDLHWADISTVDLIGYLGPELASLRLLLLASYRPSDLVLHASPFLRIEPELKMHRICEDLPLGALRPADTRHYLDARFPGHAFPADLAVHLQARSAGNALCLTAMVDCAVERGWIAMRDGRWESAAPLEQWAVGMPPSVHSMVEVKLAALAGCDREMLSAAALYGAEFDPAVLARALTLDDGFVEDRLKLVESTHRILDPAPDLSLGDGFSPRYRFSHVLYQEALEGCVGPAQRRRLCSLLAEALIARGENDPAPIGNIARLLENAGAGERALPYYARAASRAVQLSAYRQALELATRGADIARHSARTESVERLEIEFLTTRALSLTAVEGFAAPEIEKIYRRGREVARQLHDLTADASIAYLRWGVVSVASLEEARGLADSLRQEADTSQNEEAKALAQMAQGIAWFHLGAPTRGASILGEAVEHWRRMNGALGFRNYMLDPAVATLCNLARAQWFIGQPARAWRTGMEAVDSALRMGHHRTVAYAFALAADIAHLRRDLPAVLEWSQKAVELAEEHELQYEAAWAHILQGWTAAQTGDVDLALAIFERTAQYRGTCASKFLCHFAEILGKRHSYTRALAVLEDAFRLAAERGERYYLSELQRVSGEILVRSDGLESAERMLRNAVETARQSQAGSCELRAASSLARFCFEFRPDSCRQSLDELKRVVRTFPEAADTPDGAEAQRLLDRPAF